MDIWNTENIKGPMNVTNAMQRKSSCVTVTENARLLMNNIFWVATAGGNGVAGDLMLYTGGLMMGLGEPNKPAVAGSLLSQLMAEYTTKHIWG